MNNETQKGWEADFENFDYFFDEELLTTTFVETSPNDIKRWVRGLLTAQETAFKERVLACVPEEKHVPAKTGDWNSGDYNHHYGGPLAWNACRQEVLTRIERLYEKRD